MRIWLLIAVCIVCSLALHYVPIYSGRTLYPPWLVELHYAFFWFSLVFHLTSGAFYDVGKPRTTFQRDCRPLFGWVMLAHVLSVPLLRLVGVPIIQAYIGSLLVTVLLPVYSTQYVIYPLWKKSQKTTKISPRALKQQVEADPITHQFLQVFGQAALYVYDYRRENQLAGVLLQHRTLRPEQPGLWEDRLLHILIDLDTQHILQGHEKFSRYLFEHSDESSAVLELDAPLDWPTHDYDQPLTAETLQKMEQVFPRHPSLATVPLPLAIRPVPYERFEFPAEASQVTHS